MNRLPDIADLNSKIRSLIRTAESGADWAEICRIECEIVALQDEHMREMQAPRAVSA